MFRQLIAAVALSIFTSTAFAQTEETSPNLITSGSGHNWTGISITGPLPANAMPGGPGALYDPNTNTIHFSYGQATVAQTYAINQALANSGSGIQVQGYVYSWEINNLNYDNRQTGTDTLTARVITFDPTGNIRRSDSWTYNTRFDWTTFSGSVNYITPGSPSEFGNLRVEFSGVDSGFWGGYFGPQVRNVDVRLRYTAAPVDPCVSDPQSSPSCPGYKTFYSIPDDGHAIVPIPFGFPFYGQTFTHSIFFDNGAVSFYSPTQPQRWGGGGFGLPTFNESMSSSFFYTIVPLKTDLIANQGRHYTQGDGTYLRYTWEDVSQFGRWDSKNTFSLEIKPSGYIGLIYDKIDIHGGWSSAIIGDASLGEYQLIQSSIATTTTSINSWSVNQTTATDCSNPLNHPNCPGYTQAFLDQQCSINSLYSPSCPNYAQAYLSQQCSINTLYDPTCPGYATAYYDYQCSLDVLYHTGCPGYDHAYFDQQCGLDPLYDSACIGYAQAYLDQQCSLDPLYDQTCPLYADAFYIQQCTADPLYDSGCTGYAQAYFDQQCGLDPLYNNQCPGYATAFFNQQCSINTLYDSTCPGYAQAYFDQQCSLSALYDSACPGYTQAYFDQQCSADALYDRTCPGYAEAYALKFVVSTPKSSPVVEEAVVVQSTSVEEIASVVVAEPAPVAAVSAAEPAAPVQLVAEPAPAAVTSQPSSSSTTKAEPTSPAPARTTRQALAEQRLAAAREQAAKKAQQDPEAMTSEMDSASSMEQQVEIQNVVLGAMGFVAGFDVYGRITLPDATGYKPFEIYSGQRNIDTPAARGLVGRSDRLHQDMIDQQYNKN